MKIMKKILLPTDFSGSSNGAIAVVITMPKHFKPADLSLFEANNLQIDDSLLTGESLSAEKTPSAWH